MTFYVDTMTLVGDGFTVHCEGMELWDVREMLWDLGEKVKIIE